MNAGQSEELQPLQPVERVGEVNVSVWKMSKVRNCTYRSEHIRRRCLRVAAPWAHDRCMLSLGNSYPAKRKAKGQRELGKAPDDGSKDVRGIGCTERSTASRSPYASTWLLSYTHNARQYHYLRATSVCGAETYLASAYCSLSSQSYSSREMASRL